MERKGTDTKRKPRHGAERDAAQAIGGEPRPDEDEEALEKPENVPSFLTARELQAHNRDQDEEGEDTDTGERHASASFEGPKGEPGISDEDPPRGGRGLPETRTDETSRRRPGPKSK